MKNSEYTALRNLIVRGLANVDDAVLGNVMVCLTSAQGCLDTVQYDASLRRLNKDASLRWLNNAAQHLWGSFPPETVNVSNNWEYSIR